jgi:type II secretory pathway pseudopilin PulG
MMLSGRKRGFTILELLISVLLTTMVVLAAAAAIRLGFRSVEKGEIKIQHHERIRAVLDIIDAQLQSEVPLQYDEDDSRKFYFQGDMWSLQFPSTQSVRGSRSGCLLIAYQVFSEPGGPALYVYEQLMGMEEWSRTKLIDKADYIGFEYFSRDPAAGTESWTNAWNEPSKLPDKIRVSLRVNGRDLTRVFPLRARAALLQKKPQQADTTGRK